MITRTEKPQKRLEEDVHPNILSKGKKLLDMYYTVQELAEILDLKPRYIREYLIGRKGAPKKEKTNTKGRVYINGKELYEWADEFHNEKLARQKSNPLADDEFLCCKCQQHVVPENYTISITANGVRRRDAICPICGTRIFRYEKGKKIDSKRKL